MKRTLKKEREVLKLRPVEARLAMDLAETDDQRLQVVIALKDYFKTAYAECKTDIASLNIATMTLFNVYISDRKHDQAGASLSDDLELKLIDVMKSWGVQIEERQLTLSL